MPGSGRTWHRWKVHMAKRITQGRVGKDVADVVNEHADLIEQLLEIVGPLIADEEKADEDAAAAEAEKPAAARKKTAAKKPAATPAATTTEATSGE